MDGFYFAYGIWTALYLRIALSSFDSLLRTIVPLHGSCALCSRQEHGHLLLSALWPERDIPSRVPSERGYSIKRFRELWIWATPHVHSFGGWADGSSVSFSHSVSTTCVLVRSGAFCHMCAHSKYFPSSLEREFSDRWMMIYFLLWSKIDAVFDHSQRVFKWPMLCLFAECTLRQEGDEQVLPHGCKLAHHKKEIVLWYFWCCGTPGRKTDRKSLRTT